MNTTSRLRMSLLALGILGAGASMRAEGQEIRWNPVAADGNVICMPGTGDCGETEIMLSGGGVTVTLFLEVSGWDPDNDGDPSLGAYQGVLDAASLVGPGDCDLTLVGSDTGMGFEGAYQGLRVCGNIDCVVGGVNAPACVWDPFSCCEYPCAFPEPCPAGDVCMERPDFVFYQLSNFPTVSTSMSDYSWSAASNDCSADGRCDGNWGAAYQCSSGPDCASQDCQEPHFYGGTLVVEVPDLCCPPWEVGFVEDSDFTLFNSCPGPLIPGLARVPGIISMEIGSCCYGIGTPGEGCVENVCVEECNGLPGPRVFRPGVDCTVPCCWCITDLDCDDENACTIDWCDCCVCYHAPNFEVGVYCCDPVTGTTVLIDDGDACTVDTCNSFTGVVTNTYVPELCGSCCYEIGTATPGCVEVGSQTECETWSAPRLYRPYSSCEEPCPDCEVGTGPDCNNNNIADLCDILRGTSEDCNENGVPDECDLADETSDDCNNNGVPDECDLADGTSEDCTGNEVPDECEADCNANGFADSCDILDGRSEDCNENGIPDECDVDPADPDGNGQVSEDCTANGTPDECEPDCQPLGDPGHGTADSCDINDGTSVDTNGNGVPDECDLGACCYFHTPSGTFNCVEVTESVCFADWGVFDSAFLGIDTKCPTAGVSSATHQGVVVVQ